jgi:pimeloyl-ACP methyl ester carboxylesterase
MIPLIKILKFAKHSTFMNTYRKHGSAPFKTAVIHGGPGATGSLGPLAKELSAYTGILEPFQSGNSINSLVREMHEILTSHGKSPITLIGHSWGAWLSYIFAARHPEMVSKLILLASGPFEEKYIAGISETRVNRLSPEEKNQFLGFITTLNDPQAEKKDAAFTRFATMVQKADSYKQITKHSAPGQYNYNIYRSIWSEARLLRKSGELLSMASRITCPVLAIHGDYDPHPWQGVKDPLTTHIKNFRFSLLNQCGHEPWNEELAREPFFNLLKNETGN